MAPLTPKISHQNEKNENETYYNKQPFYFPKRKKTCFFEKGKKKHFEPSLQASTTYSKKILKLLIKKVGPNSKEKSPHPVLVQNVRA